MSEIAHAAVKQLQVVHALALRETRTRFGDYQLGYIWAVLEPVLWIGTFWAVYDYMGRRTPAGMDLLSFLATGFVTYNAAIHCMGQCSAAISANKALLYFPQVQVPDIIVARAYLEFSTYLTAFAVIVGIDGMIYGFRTVDSYLLIVGGFLLATLLGAGAGLVLACLSLLSKSIDRVKGSLMRPLFFMSGLFYTVESVPLRIRKIITWNPLLHVVEMVRDGWHTSYTSPIVDVPYVLMWISGLFFVGLTLERRIRHMVHSE